MTRITLDEVDALVVPEMLDIPEKLWPLILNFNDYNYFVIEGGRASAKTQSVGRVLLYIADVRQVRVVCGREIMNTIEESVHAVLADLINEKALPYEVTKKTISHHTSGSKFTYKGFLERGAVNVKGLEGVDIVWPDEAQTMQKGTLDVLIPTIRKNKSKLIFTMNRYMRDDAVIQELVGRPDCLHIKINYFDNPHCTLKIKNEAELLKNKNPKEYAHIYLGEPLAQADDYLFNYDKLYAAYDLVPAGEPWGRQRVLGIDVAAQGNDDCVVKCLDRLTSQHWTTTETLTWHEPDTMVSVGKIVDVIGRLKPDLVGIDIGGLGKPIYDRLCEIPGLAAIIIPFNGGESPSIQYSEIYANKRAEGYFLVRDWLDSAFLKFNPQDKSTVNQLEKIKFKYRSNSKKIIEEKLKMKAELGYSPDEADALMIAIYTIVNYLGKRGASNNATGLGKAATISRRHGSKRKR